jgi:hypothetical protein
MNANLIISGIVILIVLFAGCTGSPAGETCSGKATLSMNGELKACVDGKMVSTCADEGSVYSQTADEKIACSGGKWVKQAMPAVNLTVPANTTPLANASANQSATVTEPAADDAMNCTGTSWSSVNGVTQACVNGKMAKTCDNEGETYSISDFLKKKIVCENGKWTSIPLPANESEDASNDSKPPGSCTGKASMTVNNVTKVCIDGMMAGTCASEGEIYTESEFLNKRVVCEGGLWVSKTIE